MSPSASDLVRHMRSVLFRRGCRPGLRTAKTTIAAVLSFVVAQRLGTSPQPVFAPLTALLVVQLTPILALNYSAVRCPADRYVVQDFACAERDSGF